MLWSQRYSILHGVYCNFANIHYVRLVCRVCVMDWVCGCVFSHFCWVPPLASTCNYSSPVCLLTHVSNRRTLLLVIFFCVLVNLPHCPCILVASWIHHTQPLQYLSFTWNLKPLIHVHGLSTPHLPTLLPLQSRITGPFRFRLDTLG